MKLARNRTPRRRRALDNPFVSGRDPGKISRTRHNQVRKNHEGRLRTCAGPVRLADIEHLPCPALHRDPTRSSGATMTLPPVLPVHDAFALHPLPFVVCNSGWGERAFWPRQLLQTDDAPECGPDKRTPHANIR